MAVVEPGIGGSRLTGLDEVGEATIGVGKLLGEDGSPTGGDAANEVEHMSIRFHVDATRRVAHTDGLCWADCLGLHRS